MTPLNRQRWEKFKRNRRGWYASWIFLVLFILCLFANFIANDKPLLAKFDGHYYWPVFHSYAETDFGGEFATEANYRDPYVVGLIKDKGWLVMPLLPYSYNTVNFSVMAPSKPTWENWLGTDDQGRDVVARLLYGMRLSLLFGLSLTVLSSIVGIAAGAVQGYFGGLVDLAMQRFIEIWSGMPVLYLLIIMASVLAPSFFSLLGLMLLFSWMTLVHVVRAEFYRIRNFDYVRAAKALGVSDGRIMLRHILPNATVATLTFLPFVLTGSVTTLTSLDFLGFGLPPGSPSLGELLAQGKNNLQAPWLGLTAFLSIAIVLSLLTFIGEAVRDALDPRKAFTLPIGHEEQVA
jgi:microcin C transport system permease protein